MPPSSPHPVIVAAPLSSWLNDGLADRYAVYRLEPGGIAALPAGVAEAARVLVTTGGSPLANSVLDALPALALVAVHSVGVDNVDLDHARTRGILVSNTPDVLTDDVADMALALVLATARRMIVNDRMVRAGDWAAGVSIPFSRRVTGLRFGILGLGRIGTAIARRLEPIAGTIAYHSRRAVADSPYRYAESAAALARDSDVLIVATSGGAGSRHLVDAAVIDALGPEGLLINIGRGTTVDEAALVAALVDGRLGGAGLDVFEDEPRVPEALFALDQVVLQPHQASATWATRKAMADLVLANVAAFFDGKPLLSPV